MVTLNMESRNPMGRVNAENHSKTSKSLGVNGLSTKNGNGNDDAETEKGLGRDRRFGVSFNIIEH